MVLRTYFTIENIPTGITFMPAFSDISGKIFVIYLLVWIGRQTKLTSHENRHIHRANKYLSIFFFLFSEPVVGSSYQVFSRGRTPWSRTDACRPHCAGTPPSWPSPDSAGSCCCRIPPHLREAQGKVREGEEKGALRIETDNLFAMLMSVLLTAKVAGFPTHHWHIGWISLAFPLGRPAGAVRPFIHTSRATTCHEMEDKISAHLFTIRKFVLSMYNFSRFIYKIYCRNYIPHMLHDFLQLVDM